MSIKIEKLCFKYGKNLPYVLNNISLEIEDGTVNVLLGLNGCGKTTLIKALAGIFKTVEGNIYYDDKELRTLSIKERSKIVSYVPQKIFGVDDVLVRDYLTFGMVNSFKFYEAPKEKDLQKVYDISEKLNCNDMLLKKLGELSGGERQIISLAASLLQNTSVILLDEPTSALDLRNQNMVLSMLKKIADEENKTIILSSHNPNHALFLDCKTALMNDHKIMTYGDAREFISTETLKAIYGDNICLSKELPYNEISFK